MRETKLWTWHLIAGVAILVLLGLHMLTMHVGQLTGLFVADTSLSTVAPENSVARDGQLLLTIGYVLLLGVALYHGLYGLRNILLELTLGPGTARALTVVLVIVGLGLFTLGTWAAISAHGLALAGRA
jgi:succinate dehydrogenase/fumarate reductase cytochrome b subunit